MPIIGADGNVLPYDWSSILQAFEHIEMAHDLSMADALAAVHWSPVTDADKLALWFLCDFEWGLSPRDTPICHTVPAPYHTAFGSSKQRLVACSAGLLAPLEAALQSDQLRLGARVVAVSHDKERDVVVVSCQDQEYSARTVIMTVSLNVLASGAIAFVPPLPEEKVPTHQCMAQYEIVLAEFASRFWAMTHDCMLFAGPPHMLVHDLGTYYDDRPILEFHIVGNDAVRVATQTPKQTQDELMVIMRKAFGEHTPEPIRIHCTSWSSNPLTLGAFSVRPHGMSDDDHALLRKPCMGGKLFFAGDGMHEVHTGYMHAAYLSGIDVARNVALLL